jgi:hypothetical protein
MYLAIMIFSTAVKFLRNRKLARVLLIVLERVDKVALFNCVTMRFLFTDVAFNESASKIISCVAFADVTDDSEIFKRKYFGQLVDFFVIVLHKILL